MFSDKVINMMLTNLQNVGWDIEVTIATFATQFLMNPKATKEETALNYWKLMQIAGAD